MIKLASTKPTRIITSHYLVIGTLTIKEIPREYNNYQVPQRHIHPEYNATIAEICYRRAIKFISYNQNTYDTYVKQQIAVLEYLLFRFMNNSTRRYISTQEIRTSYKGLVMRNSIIRHLEIRLLHLYVMQVLSYLVARMAIKYHQQNLSCMIS